MEQEEKCPVCEDGIPAVGMKPAPCPKCGREVQVGMVFQTGKGGHAVWDYPRAVDLPGEGAVEGP